VLLSLHLPVPLDPAGLRGLAARTNDLLMSVSAVGPDDGSTAGVSRADRDAVLDTLAGHGREWLGHTVAFFGCAEIGLFETLPLSCALLERALLAARPHVRPLLAAIQRCPDYLVAITDRRHAWVLSVRGT
jgi:peptide chain release factor subunit 1